MRINRKKIAFFFTLVISGAISLNSEITQASTTHSQAISGKQKVTWSVGGDCVDLYDEYQTNYPIYEGEDCYFQVKVVPALPVRKVALQWWDDEDGRWYSEREVKTNKKGFAILRPDTTYSDGTFICDIFDYRLGVAKLGSAKSVLSQTFSLDFVSNDEDC
jgi:hypothetical protein